MTRNASPHVEPSGLSERNSAPLRWNVAKLLIIFGVGIGLCGYVVTAVWAYGLFFGGRP
ncbi:hypothetical protein [Rhizobium sp. CC-YZS058]|uniref:hypothetical protein n=1 Tax=Rhizobium sp. CC-YZS058 TaxID=3042153 RepID=UPI002B060CBE|nr:hypothetical protein [Rhizobium sp. CC-YZS058]MEA3534261.1 hypothetical protein [Rhizobium sp. CC-YZS058]